MSGSIWGKSNQTERTRAKAGGGTFLVHSRISKGTRVAEAEGAEAGKPEVKARGQFMSDLRTFTSEYLAARASHLHVNILVQVDPILFF